MENKKDYINDVVYNIKNNIKNNNIYVVYIVLDSCVLIIEENKFGVVFIWESVRLKV